MAREPFNRIWTETPVDPDFDPPTETMWSEGWRGGAAAELPEAFAQNWWQNRADFALQDVEQRGAMEWVGAADYKKGTVAVGTDGRTYEATADNTGVNPVTDTSKTWVVKPQAALSGNNVTQNGYYSLPGGLIIQWASATVTIPTVVGGESTRSISIDLPLQNPGTYLNGGCFKGPRGSALEDAEMAYTLSTVTQTTATATIRRISGSNPGLETVEMVFFLLFKEQ
jgi:hypothetical protein